MGVFEFLLYFSLFFNPLPLYQEISSKDKSHSGSNIFWLQGSRNPSLEEVGSEGLEGAQVSTFQETLQAKHPSSSEIIPMGLVNEAFKMMEVEVLWLWDYCKFLDNFHFYVPSPGDRVTSGS